MLVVMVVIGLLATIAVLKYIDVRNTARTAALTGDFRAVTVAVMNYYADHEVWPPETGAGQVPAGLASYLPGALTQSFDRTALGFSEEIVKTALIDSAPPGVRPPASR